MEISSQSTDFCPKGQFLSTGDHSYENKSFTFQFLTGGVGSLYKLESLRCKTSTPT